MSERQPFRFGLPGGRGTFAALAEDSKTELAVTAERLGFDAVWFSEAHFSAADAPARRHPSSPIVLASAVVARTRRLRVGLSTLLELHHPILVAEQVATLDALSDGRVDVVIGRASARDLAAFGPVERSAAIPRRLELLLEYWSGRPIEVDGRTHLIEPELVQRPHPPIYLHAPDASATAWAAEHGHSIIVPALAGPEGLGRRLRGFAEHGGEVASAPVERFCLVAETDAQAQRIARPLIEQLVAQTRHPYTHEPPPSDLRPEDLEPGRFATETALIGGPDTVAERILELAERHGVRAINPRPSLTGLCPLPAQRDTVALFAEKVMPKLTSDVRGTPHTADLPHAPGAR